jgi:hypothetical protein
VLEPSFCGPFVWALATALLAASKIVDAKIRIIEVIVMIPRFSV